MKGTNVTLHHNPFQDKNKIKIAVHLQTLSHLKSTPHKPLVYARSTRHRKIPVTNWPCHWCW